jgi:hypothetical protein
LKVLTEDQTIDEVLAGRSIARIGDGELKLARGRPIKAQRWTPELGAEMREICASNTACLVGIPNLGAHYMPPERSGYIHFVGSPACQALYTQGRIYGSSFITRPDCAPHIDRPEYWAKVRSLWTGRDVVLVYGSGKGLRPTDLTAAASHEDIRAPAVEAWDIVDELFHRLKKERRTVLLCLGAVATVLAHRLAERGVHAVDIGGIGRFMRASQHAAL